MLETWNRKSHVARSHRVYGVVRLLRGFNMRDNNYHGKGLLLAAVAQ